MKLQGDRGGAVCQQGQWQVPDKPLHFASNVTLSSLSFSFNLSSLSLPKLGIATGSSACRRLFITEKCISFKYNLWETNRNDDANTIHNFKLKLTEKLFIFRTENTLSNWTRNGGRQLCLLELMFPHLMKQV